VILLNDKKDTYGKPVHEICVDKTSCRHETNMDKDVGGEPEPTFVPTGHLTKDVARKNYENQQKGSNKS
jgi:hypothetical protein